VGNGLDKLLIGGIGDIVIKKTSMPEMLTWSGYSFQSRELIIGLGPLTKIEGFLESGAFYIQLQYWVFFQNYAHLFSTSKLSMLMEEPERMAAAADFRKGYWNLVDKLGYSVPVTAEK
jgi:hypothetical protein